MVKNDCAGLEDELPTRAHDAQTPIIIFSVDVKSFVESAYKLGL
jgi:hypothetical protein